MRQIMRGTGPNSSAAKGWILTARGLLALVAHVGRAEIVDPLAFHAVESTTVPRRIVREFRLKSGAQRQLEGMLRSADSEGDVTRGAIVLGQLDQHGRLVASGTVGHSCSRCSGRPTEIPQTQSVERQRSRLELLCTEQGLAVRKSFFGPEAKRRFVHEVSVLRHLMAADCDVAPILGFDPSKLAVTTPYLGPSVEQLLTDRGACLTGPELSERAGRSLSPREVHAGYFREGSRVVEESQLVDPDEILELLRSAHRSGVTVREVSYSNVVQREDGRLSLIDFEAATLHRSPRSIACLVDRDRDIESFNLAFGRQAPTRGRLQAAAIASAVWPLDNVYGVAYVGRGVRLGRLFNPSSGFGKWHFLVRWALPNPMGLSAISLGSNNAAIELQMLRAGAKKIVCYEMNEDFRAQAAFLKEAFEWADNRAYDLEIRPDNMVAVMEDSSTYDLAMALCSLYYLSEVEMRAVTQHLSAIAKSMALQCNVGTNIGRDDLDQYRRASVEFAVRMAAEAGFQAPRPIVPARYSRPMVLAAGAETTAGEVVDLTDASALPVTRKHESRQ